MDLLFLKYLSSEAAVFLFFIISGLQVNNNPLYSFCLLAELGSWGSDVLSRSCTKHRHALLTPPLTLRPSFMTATNSPGSFYVAQIMPPVM